MGLYKLFILEKAVGFTTIKLRVFLSLLLYLHTLLIEQEISAAADKVYMRQAAMGSSLK